jgi:hypothetical protein
MPIKQEREKWQHKTEKIDTTLSHKYKMRHKMWEDRQQPFQENRFSEARGGHEQEGVINKK